MRLGFITYGLDRSLSGIGRYTVELVRALGSLTEGPDVMLLTAGGVGVLGKAPFRQASLPGCRLLPGLVMLGNLLIPLRAQQLDLELVHDPTGVTPLLFGAGGARTVVTVHDVFAWSCPGTSTTLDTLIYRHWLPRVLPRVDAVITVSRSSKVDIVRYLRVDPDKVHVVYEGVNPVFRPLTAGESNRVGARYGFPDSYLLFVGSVEMRKNLRGLLPAYANLRRMGERRPLVVVGAGRGKAPDIMGTIQELDLEQHVIFTGYVPDGDLPALYSGADLFILPSLYEGFGLPVLEAMACGAPVVCSNAGSLPEVAGDAAIMVDPHDTEGLAEAMQRVLTDADLRDDLREKGLQRARQFTWERTARETVAVYREVLGG